MTQVIIISIDLVIVFEREELPDRTRCALLGIDPTVKNRQGRTFTYCDPPDGYWIVTWPDHVKEQRFNSWPSYVGPFSLPEAVAMAPNAGFHGNYPR